MNKELENELAKKIAKNTEQEIPRIIAIFKAGLCPHSTDDFQTAVEKIEREQGA